VIGAPQHYPPVRSLRDPGRGLRPAPGGFSTRRYADVPFDSFGEARLNPALAYPMERLRPEPLLLPPSESPSVQTAYEGWRCASAESLTGAAGELANLQLFNPGGSGQLIVVEMVIIATTTAQRVSIRDSNTRLATLNFNWRRTSNGKPFARGEIREESNATTFGAAIIETHVLANDSVILPDLNFILKEGEGLIVEAGTVATLIRVTFIGREYDESTRGAA